MAQTSFDVVRRAIEFDSPDRLPVKIEGGPPESDVFEVRWNFIGPGDLAERQALDEWGCLWVRSDKDNMGQIKGHPLDDWAKLEHYTWPDPDDPKFYEGMESRFEGSQDKYVITFIFMFLFERMQALRGFENMMMDFHSDRESLEKLADRIVEFNLHLIENISRRFPGQIHGVWFTEDWGTQQSLMIRPKLWREFFKPRYRRMLDAMHAVGWHAWMHTDGKMNVIMEDLCELGVDVLNLHAPLVNGIEEIGAFQGRLCFETQVDVQSSMPFKPLTEIEQEAALLLNRWGAPTGGFILGIDQNEAALDIPHWKNLAMKEIFLRLDPFKKGVSLLP